jgi:hypothetical protein
MADPELPEQQGEQDKKLSQRMRLQVVAVVAAIVLFAFAVGAALHFWYIEPETSGQKKDLVQAVALITAGAGGALGVYFTWRGQRQTREAQEQNQKNTLEQLKQARDELDITRRGQITERFTQAIEQLGSDSLQIRLGGIYSLERTAREDRDYHWPIMEVLTTYVRQQAPRNWDKGSSDEHAEASKPDIQAILTVIGRRSEYHRDVEYGRIDLHDTSLQGASLRDAYLRGADFAGADLRNASLAGANLQGVLLENTILRSANLVAVDLRTVYFMDTDLTAAVLDEADLRTADLSRAIGLTQEQLDNALGDSHTVVPHNLQQPELWTLDINEQRRRQRQLFLQAIDSIEAEQSPDEQPRGGDRPDW